MNAVILSKIIFLWAKKKKKTRAHLQYAFDSCAKFQNECLKTQKGVDIQSYYLLMKPNLKIV